MSKKLFLLLGILCLMLACKKSTSSLNLQEQREFIKYEKAIKKLIAFFNNNAYEESLGTYYSEIDNNGHKVSDKVYTVALSRLIYGLSYASKIDNSYLEKANKAADFQLRNLSAKDSMGCYFKSFFDSKSKQPDSSLYLDIWQQAYGLCGLTELYRTVPNDTILTKIHQCHNSFINRFHDTQNGGFYGNYDIQNGVVTGSKSLQSLMYPITAYMANLWLADSINRKEYEPFIKENLSIAYNKAWNRDYDWVNVKFDDQWKPCEAESSQAKCSSVTPGHNFQFAALLLRAATWPFLTRQEQEKYHKLGIEILTKTLAKKIYSKENLSQGFCSEINVLSNEILDKRKTWWQHCEALIALSLAGEKFEKEFYNLQLFYFDSFFDKNVGGEYFFLDENNLPVTDELKGNIGKSTYHTIEMIRFLNS